MLKLSKRWDILIKRVYNVTMCNSVGRQSVLIIGVGGGETGGLQPPKLGRNPFYSGKFSQRTIGNSGNFSDCSPALFDITCRKFTAPPKFGVLNFTSGPTPCENSSSFNSKCCLNALDPHSIKISRKALAIFTTIIKTGCKSSKVLEEKPWILLSYWVKG